MAQLDREANILYDKQPRSAHRRRRESPLLLRTAHSYHQASHSQCTPILTSDALIYSKQHSKSSFEWNCRKRGCRRVCHWVGACHNRNYTEQSECSSRKSSPSLDRCRKDDISDAAE